MTIGKIFDKYGLEEHSEELTSDTLDDLDNSLADTPVPDSSDLEAIESARNDLSGIQNRVIEDPNASLETFHWALNNSLSKVNIEMPKSLGLENFEDTRYGKREFLKEVRSLEGYLDNALQTGLESYSKELEASLKDNIADNKKIKTALDNAIKSHQSRPIAIKNKEILGLFVRDGKLIKSPGDLIDELDVIDNIANDLLDDDIKIDKQLLCNGRFKATNKEVELEYSKFNLTLLKIKERGFFDSYFGAGFFFFIVATGVFAITSFLWFSLIFAFFRGVFRTSDAKKELEKKNPNVTKVLNYISKLSSCIAKIERTNKTLNLNDTLNSKIKQRSLIQLVKHINKLQRTALNLIDKSEMPNIPKEAIEQAK